MAEFDGMFSPSRIAVIGATDREGSVGRAVTENLLCAFEGDVVPVNPNREAVLGVPCVPDVASAGDVDLAIVAVPPTVAVDVVRETGEAGVGSVVVVTAGFGETGGEGAARERELREVAEAYDLDLVGPNSLGVMSTPVGMNATFGPAGALPGNISFMSQSGAFVTAVLDWATDQGIGFKDVVSLGNKAVLDETDFVTAWGDDPGTDVILGYLESIEHGRTFVDRAREVTKSTPIVLVKSGRTDAGARAASSHTGAIAGSDAAYEAGLAQAGVLRVDTVEKLFDFARVLADQPLPASDGIGIVTNAGGPGVLTTDAVGDSDLSLASFSPDTLDALSAALPAEANVHNPVDVIGDAGVDRFRRALDVVLSDPGVGSVVVLSAPTAILPFEELASAIVECRAEHEVPVVACLMGGSRVEPAAERLREAGVPNYFDPARAVRGLDALADYRDVRAREYEPPATYDVDEARARKTLRSAAERGGTRVGVEAMDLLSAYGISIPAGEIVDSPGEAREVAERFGEPVVMKIVSPDILHKSDIGGVEVGVSVDEVAGAYEDLLARARNYQPDATILGVQIQERVDLDAGVETILGMHRDPQFGPLLMFGLGGVFVEILEDTAFRVAPISEHEAREMTTDVRSAPLLRGARGRDPVDLDAVVDSIGRLSQLVTDHPAILELDVNPLVATPEGATALDLRLTIDPDLL